MTGITKVVVCAILSVRPGYLSLFLFLPSVGVSLTPFSAIYNAVSTFPFCPLEQLYSHPTDAW